jgi:predicted transcriptional regulator
VILGKLHGVLLSVRPRFSRGLLDGSKMVELRRRPIRVEPGALVALYEAAPTKAVTGFVFVKAIHEAQPDLVWRKLGGKALVSRQEYKTYFHGCDRAFAIEVCSALRIPAPISLGALRQQCPGFIPPQSFRYFATLPVSLLSVVVEALTAALAPRKRE